jgi:hypothetical protein
MAEELARARSRSKLLRMFESPVEGVGTGLGAFTGDYEQETSNVLLILKKVMGASS